MCPDRENGQFDSTEWNHTRHNQMNALGNDEAVFISLVLTHLVRRCVVHITEIIRKSMNCFKWPQAFDALNDHHLFNWIHWAHRFFLLFDFCCIHRWARFLFEWIWFWLLCVHSSRFYWNVRDFSLFCGSHRTRKSIPAHGGKKRVKMHSRNHRRNRKVVFTQLPDCPVAVVTVRFESNAKLFVCKFN